MWQHWRVHKVSVRMREIRRQTGKLEQPLMTETTETSGIFGNLGDMIFAVKHSFIFNFYFWVSSWKDAGSPKKETVMMMIMIIITIIFFRLLWSGSGKDASIYLVIMKNPETSHFDSISLKEQAWMRKQTKGIHIYSVVAFLVGRKFWKTIRRRLVQNVIERSRWSLMRVWIVMPLNRPLDFC